MGLLSARLGRPDEAREAARQLGADDRPYQFGQPQVAQARIAGLLRDTVTAVSAIRNAFNAGRYHDEWIHRTPELAFLRSNAEFRELVRLRR